MKDRNLSEEWINPAFHEMDIAAALAFVGWVTLFLVLS